MSASSSRRAGQLAVLLLAVGAARPAQAAAKFVINV